jgi:hypothetical protein
MSKRASILGCVVIVALAMSACGESDTDGSASNAGAGAGGNAGNGNDESPDDAYTSIEWDTTTSGGITGDGVGSFHLAGGVHSHKGIEGDELCSESLEDAQMKRLLDTADAVDWESLAADYPADGADMIQFDFEVRLVTSDGSDEEHNTRWTDGAELPAAFTAFLTIAGEVSQELGIVPGCDL